MKIRWMEAKKGKIIPLYNYLIQWIYSGRESKGEGYI